MLPLRTTGSPAGRPALRRCVSIPTERFAEEHWSQRPLLSTGGEFADLFGLDAVDDLLTRRGLRTPFIRLAKDGAVIDPSRYTGQAGAGAEIADQVVDERVMQLFVDGATIVLQALHRTWPPLVDFGQQLATDLGHPVQINAYVTPPQNQGFAAHYDVHDVFVLQVAGEKRWLIHEPVLEHPLRSQPWNARSDAVAARASEEPVIDTVLRPGDALYLPRGWLHSAQALGATSVHLTIGVHPVTRHALVDVLAALAADVPTLRESLPLGIDLDDPTALAPELTAVVDALAGWLHTADPSVVASRLRAAVRPQSRPEPVTPLAQAAAVAALDQQTVVRLRRHLHCAASDLPDGSVVLRLPDRTLTLPALTAPAVKTLLSGAPVRVGDLPGLDPGDRVVLVRRLLREAVCVPSSVVDALPRTDPGDAG
ncbi:cupin domain-containing protein [Cryptosporangium aurantiacum]|uniref:cupin domain-containing protein n=1 Tax=Cryptosporangium aurantiacum TaxID=134849 RepID=UPI000933B40E|nr:cupin domain-containing protein [Cryptosporangium aurantiacum]